VGANFASAAQPSRKPRAVGYEKRAIPQARKAATTASFEFDDNA
jgi:hypothetical protein